ncbi:MAG: DNA mismatch repair endonuclease MutL [Bacteroidales bacterium]|nr:DNA mismatch repair endonuclease MutL [Bacteroidales bacterium]
MPDVIQLLPDSVANQIAAGEVIQRPASAVKELLENAVDSGADDIKLVIKDAGKTLIQVIDNGCAMSETDARLCFERHATSKIKEANDLFAIKTLGFRGEALASVAAIAQVELKTKRIEDTTATQIRIEASKVIMHEACAHPDGTSISVKNLFYNIPARRKFLKSNTTELRHIIEEFQRVALVRPEIRFSFYNDGRELFILNTGNLKQRIVALFGTGFNNKLVPVEQNSDVVSISGFIGKPESARKTRGEQYFFVNGRYIRHPYLNHAVDSAFRELIPNDAYPTYFIYFEVKPEEIDINIHPTKTEVNFQNNQVIYAMLASAIKQSLGKFNISPSLDFETQIKYDIPVAPKDKPVGPPKIRVNPEYNPFNREAPKESFEGVSRRQQNKDQNWSKLYETDDVTFIKSEPDNRQQKIESFDESEITEDVVFQLHKKFIVCKVKSGMMIIYKRRALERIYFEDLMKNSSGKAHSQQLLYPETIQLSGGDSAILDDLQTEMKQFGFDIDNFGSNAFIVNGIPAGMNNVDIRDVLDNIIENARNSRKEALTDKSINLARSMAVNMAIRHTNKMSKEEIKSLIDKLFACKAPEVSPDGKPVVRIISLEELEQKF